MADGVPVSFPKLNKTNWGSWRQRMEWFLEDLDLWEVVSQAKPESVTPAWQRRDKKARAKIGLFLEESQFKVVKDAESARAMWHALKEHHEKATMSTIMHYLVMLCSANMDEGGDMSSHLAFMEDLLDKLAAAGQKIDEMLQIAMVFRSVPPSYRSLVQTLQCQIDADWTLVMVKSRLLEEYNQRKDRGEEEELKQEVAMKMEVASGRSVKLCYYCGEPGHFKYNCERWLAQKGTGNSDWDSVKIRKKKEVPKVKALGADSEDRDLCLLADGLIPGRWVIDSGATRHMTNDRSFFSSLDTNVKSSVTLANGNVTKVVGIGSGVIFGEDGCGKRVKVTLENVLFVPGLDGGLLSVSRLVAKGFVVKFGALSCEVLNVNGRTELLGDRIGSLYELRLREQPHKLTEITRCMKVQTSVATDAIGMDVGKVQEAEDLDEWFDACDAMMQEEFCERDKGPAEEEISEPGGGSAEIAVCIEEECQK